MVRGIVIFDFIFLLLGWNVESNDQDRLYAPVVKLASDYFLRMKPKF